MVCSVFVECCDVRVKFDLKHFKTAWSLAETSFEGVDQRQGGPQHNLEFLRRREGWCHCLRDFWCIATAGLRKYPFNGCLLYSRCCHVFFFSEMFLRNVALTNFPKISMSFISQFTVYISVCWIPRTLGRSWRPGGMPWVFCPCQWAPCQAKADRVPRALRALRWCADAAALEFQSIAWCHGRLSSRGIQALGMLEGHRTMFNMFNHMWWSFLKRRTVFSKECTKCLRAFCFNLDWIWHIPFLRTRSFLRAGWLLRRLVAKRSQPRSTAASRVGSSKLRSTPCPTRRGCRSASASSRRNLCVKLTCFLLRIYFLQQIQQHIYSNLVLCFHFAKLNVSGCHYFFMPCDKVDFASSSPSDIPNSRALSRKRSYATESNQENATSLSLEYDLLHFPGWFNTFRTFWNMEASWMIPVCKENLSSMHCKMAIWMLQGPKLSNRDATSKRHSLRSYSKGKYSTLLCP